MSKLNNAPHDERAASYMDFTKNALDDRSGAQALMRRCMRGLKSWLLDRWDLLPDLRRTGAVTKLVQHEWSSHETIYCETVWKSSRECRF